MHDESIVSALLKPVFEYFHEDDSVKAIWFDSTTPKAFCAGGDVRKPVNLSLIMK